MYFADHLVLDAPRRTADGYMAVRARAARTGVYQYTGREVDPDNTHGLRDQASVNVLRDENTVFDQRSAHSFIGKPITDDHPREGVNAGNWRDHARGVVMGAMRDGDHLAFDLLLTDAATIAKVDAGKVELSNGYQSGLEFGDFKAADGTACQARQTNIGGNHVAIVDRGRAGPTCRIADAAPCDAAPRAFLDSLTTKEKPVKTMLIDGLTVDIANADTAEATIKTLLAQRDSANAKIADAEKSAETLTADKAKLEAEVATLKKAVADAKPTPAQLLDAAKSFALTRDKAKALGVAITDSMDEPAIKRAVIDARMGDEAKDWTDDQVAASFALIAKDAKPAAPSGTPIQLGDARASAASARATWLAAKENAHRSAQSA